MNIFSLSAVLLFFPSITFGLLTSEVFPWGVIFSAIYMRYCSPQFMLIGALLYASSFFVLATLYFSSFALDTDVIRSLAAYLNILLLSQALLSLGRDRALQICSLSRGIFGG